MALSRFFAWKVVARSQGRSCSIVEKKAVNNPHFCTIFNETGQYEGMKSTTSK